MAILLGLSTFAVSFNVLSLYIRTEQVVVASRDLEPYRKISSSDLKVVELPEKAIHPLSIRNTENLIGSYTLTQIFTGQVFLSGHVVSAETQPGISTQIPQESRGIFIPAEMSRAVGGLINTGDRVDLIWSRMGTSFYQDDDSCGTITILRGARVVQVITDKSSGDFRGVVVAVLPEVCEKIAHYLETGNVYLSLAPWETLGTSIHIEAEVWPGK